jgi:hypothetical protein
MNLLFRSLVLLASAGLCGSVNASPIQAADIFMGPEGNGA